MSSVKKHKQKDDNQNGSSEEQNQIYRSNSVTKTEKSFICDMPITVLSFLEEGERERVINELENIQVKPNARIHPVLIEYKKSIEEWKKHEKENAYIRRGRYDYYRGQKIEQPIFMNEVSESGLKRIIVILDTL